MTKIKDLIQFEEIKDVIDIDSDIDTFEGKKGIVSNYIVSKRLKDSVRIIMKNISIPKGKSIQIIGGYGSGKSHLLAWIISLLENNELIDLINDQELKSEFSEELERNFAVVQFELQPSSASLSEFFFDRIEQQLEEKYNIKIPEIDLSGTVNFKKEVQKIVDIIKEKDPTMGFVVVIDEISDFLKGKTKENITRDIQFLRILGQVSQKIDFRFIGSMQENVFSDPKYIDQAEEFGRTAERFVQITISKEDIKEVISKRVLKKTNSQKIELDSLLSEYKEKFPLINANPDSYIEIFPIHPYVIKIFDELPYFEKRGVIQFSMDRVREILDYDFPYFITYDEVFDEMNSKHTIRNLEQVHPIMEAYETLQNKIDTLSERDKEDAEKIVKALAILNIKGNQKINGATTEELANTLLIKTDGLMESADRIAVVLDRVREAANGQYILKNDNNYYSLETKGTDFDAVIKRKKRILPEGIEDEELLKLVKYTDLIDSNSQELYVRKFADICNWQDKKSFRIGSFIFDDGSEVVEKGEDDFNLVLLSPYKGQSKISSSKDTAILKINLTDEFDDLLKSLAAIRLLISENFQKTEMEKINKKTREKTKDALLKLLLDAEIEIDGDRKKITSVITREPDNIDEFFHYLKERLFSDYFNSKYPKYPKFLNQLSHENIKGEVESTISEMVQKSETGMFSNAKNMLSALELIDLEGYIETGNSVYAKVIMDKLKVNENKNVKTEELAEKLLSSPFGLNIEIIQLILLVLTYNGDINLRKKGGGTITSSDLTDIAKSGLKAFESIPYAIIDVGPNKEKLRKLFNAIGLNPGLIKNEKEWSRALQEFRTKALEIKGDLESISNSFSEITTRNEPIINHSDFNQIIEELDDFPVNTLLNVKTVNDFKKVEELGDISTELKQKIDLISKMKGFINDYNDFIYKDYHKMENSLERLKSYPSIFLESDISPLVDIYNEITPLMKKEKLLNSEDRRILKGKLQQYKLKFAAIYFMKHEKTVGENINWNKLEKINQNPELRHLRDMTAIRSINSLKLNKINDEITALLKARCSSLNEEQVEENYTCPWCKFPETLKEIDNIEDEIDNIEDSIGKISDEWTRNVLSEIESYQDNIKLLSDNEREIIESIRTNKALPNEISQSEINAINNLTREIVVKRLSSKELLDFIFSDSEALDYDSFSDKLEEFKRKKILEDNDKKNIRIQKED